jgi:peroxiredoxin
MDAYLLEWASLLLRWAHVITAVAWIGASFYFVMLDNSLSAPEHDDLKAKGVDEVWCVAVNDAFVMGAWGREQKVGGKVRMMGDGSATWTKALGLELDLNARGMGVRSQRYAAYIVDGVVQVLHVEGSGAFEVSDAASMIKAI